MMGGMLPGFSCIALIKSRVKDLTTNSFLFFLVVSLMTAVAADKPARFQTIAYGQPRRIGILADQEIRESSGLACSLLDPDAFWTHNDSGDIPRLFLIDRSGQTLAEVVIEGAQAVDWEDIASFKLGTQSYLLIGDVGDNAAARQLCALYVVREPRIDRKAKTHTGDVRPFITIPFMYEDGPHDCESVGVDATSGTIYLVSKEKGDECNVYELSLPMEEAAKQSVARKIAKLDIPKVTAMDISSDGRRAVALTYGDAYEYIRGEAETWAKAFARKGRVLPMPRRVGGESICYGVDGKTLYLTSENPLQPLWEIPAVSTME
jgi:hypothetical protein